MLPIWIKTPLEEYLRKRRRNRVFKLLNPLGEGLEIGPCHNGIALKREGYSVRILDHLDRQGLLAKYQEHGGVDTSKIEEVDYVWSGQAYGALVNGTEFDWIIASHVIEHVPDLVKFLQDCSSILKKGGKLFLVVPDARREFDLLRYPSGSGEVIDAHLRGDLRPSPGSVFEHHIRACTKGRRHAWPFWWPGKVRTIHTALQAHEAFQGAAKGEYRDVHVWRFTPESFVRLMDDLAQMDSFDLRLEGVPWTSGSEFSVCLGKRP